jgi:hypothetical protein
MITTTTTTTTTIIIIIIIIIIIQWVAIGGLMVSVLAIGPKFHVFKPGLERWDFSGR